MWPSFYIKFRNFNIKRTWEGHLLKWISILWYSLSVVTWQKDWLKREKNVALLCKIDIFRVCACETAELYIVMYLVLNHSTDTLIRWAQVIENIYSIFWSYRNETWRNWLHQAQTIFGVLCGVEFVRFLSASHKRKHKNKRYHFLWISGSAEAFRDEWVTVNHFIDCDGKDDEDALVNDRVIVKVIVTECDISIWSIVFMWTIYIK